MSDGTMPNRFLQPLSLAGMPSAWVPSNCTLVASTVAESTFERPNGNRNALYRARFMVSLPSGPMSSSAAGGGGGGQLLPAYHYRAAAAGGGWVGYLESYNQDKNGGHEGQWSNCGAGSNWYPFPPTILGPKAASNSSVASAAGTNCSAIPLAGVPLPVPARNADAWAAFLAAYGALPESSRAVACCDPDALGTARCFNATDPFDSNVKPKKSFYWGCGYAASASAFMLNTWAAAAASAAAGGGLTVPCWLPAPGTWAGPPIAALTADLEAPEGDYECGPSCFAGYKLTCAFSALLAFFGLVSLILLQIIRGCPCCPKCYPYPYGQRNGAYVDGRWVGGAACGGGGGGGGGGDGGGGDGGGGGGCGGGGCGGGGCGGGG